MSEQQGEGQQPFRVAVAGASGYAGGEVLRLLAPHPLIDVSTLTGHSSVGQDLAQSAPHLAATMNNNSVDGSGASQQWVIRETTVENLSGHDAVVLALPHGQSSAIAAELRAREPGALILDLGADHRLESAADWREYYGTEHAGAWPYGMPELPLFTEDSVAEDPERDPSQQVQGARESQQSVIKQREYLRTAREIAVPGCNATAVTLGLAPLLRAGLVDPEHLTATLPVGYTGAGKSATPHLLFSEAANNAAPYAAGGTHRHIPEILQNLRKASGVTDARLTFTPVLVPMSRGILAVITAPLASTATTTQDLFAALQADYANEPFIQVLPEQQLPATGNVIGSNLTQIGALADRRSGHATVLVALDNLVKGTAGAALQCLNLALGIAEATGVPRVPLRP